MAQMPWDKRANELFDREGAYAGYIAWREWMDRKGEFDVDLISRVTDRESLFATMIQAIDEAIDLVREGNQCSKT